MKEYLCCHFDEPESYSSINAFNPEDAAEKFIENEERNSSDFSSLDGAVFVGVKEKHSDEWTKFEVHGTPMISYSASRYKEGE